MYKKTLWTLTLLVMCFTSYAQQEYTIDITNNEKEIIRGHLDLGGSNPKGDSISVNSYYIELNGEPFFPIVGEFHYSRYPAQYWEESILKMKAGGINVIASYVFWNLHERTEGEFDWTGNLNLRRFIELCEKHEIFTIVRLGPFDHGEMRNGGLPDWLYGKPFEVRSNDPGYLTHVEKLYQQIGTQLAGKLFKDGGSVIGVQLENEFQHSAAPWELNYPGLAREYTVADRDAEVTQAGVSISEVANENAAYGQDHMANLKKIAKEAGIDVPIYTATGWGNAAIVQKGSIPVTAGYAYPTWASEELSPFYLYKDIHKHPDYAPVSFDPELYPSLPAELGSGIQITSLRRPEVVPASLAPMIVRTIGSGSNGIGYYMYHGGSTPVFDHFYSEESTGVPKISYDFQAPIGEFGQLRYHYHDLKLLHLFLESYGPILAPMKTVLPETNEQISPADTTTLRYAVRAKDSTGFIFMHNFQDHLETKDLQNLRITIQHETGKLPIPHNGTFTLNKQVSAILPFNLNLDGVMLKYATAQPLTQLNHQGQKHFVFFSHPGLEPRFAIQGEDYAIQTVNCETNQQEGVTYIQGSADEVFSFAVEDKQFLVVPKTMALKAWKSSDERMFFSDGTILTSNGQFEVYSKAQEKVDVQVYPATQLAIQMSGARLEEATAASEQMSAFSIRFEKVDPMAELQQISSRKYVLKKNVKFEGLHDVWMKANYTGDRCLAFIEGKLVADHLYYGKPWEVGLRKFHEKLQTEDMVLVFHPMHQDYNYLMDFDEAELPNFDGQNPYLEVGEFEFIPEYKGVFTLQ